MIQHELPQVYSHVIPQGYPQVYYTQPYYPYIPTYSGIPLAAPGVNPENPIEVESPADNQPAEELKANDDNDSVSVESA